jgi:hypothetical protein
MFRLIARRQGFTYVDARNAALFADARAGSIVRIPERKGPWLIVDHRPETVIVTRWPGRLWRTEIVSAISEAEERAARSTRTAEGHARYTRAAAVKLIEEVHPGIMFGKRGAKVCKVIDRAPSLTENEAAALANARDSRAGSAYSSAWRKWLEGQPEGQSGTHHLGQDMDGTLAVGSLRSPLGSALMIISGEVSRRAQEVAGKSVLIPDRHDPEGAVLAEPWAAASGVLCDAAMAFGAPDLLSPQEADILATPWRKVFGDDPA